MAKYSCTITFSILLFSAVVRALDIDYYWKDYNGELPYDAFVAVQNSDNTAAAYIGQSFIENCGTFPGTLLPNATSVTITASGSDHVSSKNLKILATEHPWKLQWAKIHYNDIAIIKKLNFLRIVHGGLESEEDVYIGRKIHEGSMQIGKVYNADPWRGLAFPNRAGGAGGILEFELLVYVPDCY